MDNFFPDEAVEEDGWYEQALKEGYGFKSEQERDDYIKSLGSHQYYICHNMNNNKENMSNNLIKGTQWTILCFALQRMSWKRANPLS